MKSSDMIPSKFLKQQDVDEDTIVTIVGIKRDNLANDGEPPEFKYIIKFEEFSKPMVLNATNIRRIESATGEADTDDWKGKRVILYVDPDIEFGGKVTGGLRIKRVPKPSKPMQESEDFPPKEKKAAQGVDTDDIPF